MRAFVTGSTGMLGHNLVRHLLEMGWEVRALVRSVEKAKQLFQGLTLETVQGDMENVAGFTAALEGWMRSFTPPLFSGSTTSPAITGRR